jgi:putative peptidoglycan lipid II flippase
MASGLPTGSVAVLNYANLIYVMPQVFMSPAIGAVFYRVLAAMAARKDTPRVVSSVKKGLSLSAYFGFPISAGIYLLAIPLVQIIYQRGAFGKDAVAITGAILAMYVLGLPALALRDVCSRAHYAEGDTLTPLYTGGIAIAVNIVLIIILARYLFAPGLALATAVANWTGALTLMWAWNKKHKGLPGASNAHPFARDFWVELGKILVSMLVLAAVVGQSWDKLLRIRLSTALTDVRPGSIVFTWLHLEYFSLAFLLGIISYLLCSSLLKSENAAYITSMVKQFGTNMSKRIHKG